MSQNERRQHPRAPVNRPGRIRVGNSAEANTQIIDVGESGVSVFYSEPVAIGAKVELRFSLTIASEKQWFLAEGSAVHHYVRGESHIVGIAFVNPHPDMIKAIGVYVTQKMQAAG